MLALISLSLAIINLFPFLPLDGGHVFWAVAEKLRGKRIPFEVMERAGVVGFVLILHDLRDRPHERHLDAVWSWDSFEVGVLAALLPALGVVEGCEVVEGSARAGSRATRTPTHPPEQPSVSKKALRRPGSCFRGGE